MLKYKVEVTRISDPKDGERYPNQETIYQQTLEAINLSGLIAVVNDMRYYMVPGHVKPDPQELQRMEQPS